MVSYQLVSLIPTSQVNEIPGFHRERVLFLDKHQKFDAKRASTFLLIIEMTDSWETSEMIIDGISCLVFFRGWLCVLIVQDAIVVYHRDRLNWCL